MLTLFLVTFRIGLFSFGGGMAMFAMMQREYADRLGWCTREEMVDILAVSQTLPGVIAVNSSILIGYRIAGTLGAMVAVFGSVLPSFLVLTAVAFFFDAFEGNPYFAGAMRGIRGAVIGLLAFVLISMRKQTFPDRYGVLLFAAALCATVFLPSLNVIIIILSGAALGILIYYCLLRKRRPEDYD